MTAQQTITRNGKAITIRNVQANPYTKFGIRHEGRISEGQHIDLIPGESIRLFGYTATTQEPCDYDLTFRVGDHAEYDSYNYHYTGVITAIGHKTISIEYDHGSRSRRKRLSLWEFSWRNRDYNAAKIAANNVETGRCI